MSDATVRFLPWMRRGLVRTLSEQADETGRPTAESGTFLASALLAQGTDDEAVVSRALRVRGPGDAREWRP